MICYLLLSALTAAAAFAAKSRRTVNAIAAIFYAIQALLPVWIVATGRMGSHDCRVFVFDETGVLFHTLSAVVSAFVFGHSVRYFRDESPARYKQYMALLMLLTCAIAGVYFADNIAVTWIFLETTTLCAAGLIYHRGTEQALEATWKYIFVCSTGIAAAYLGILLLCSVAADGSLSYEALAHNVAHGNPTYLKTAFVLILCGYSCKMEIFPLYTIGVDANFAAPAPATAMISTALVNAGFVAIFRVYKVMAASEAFEWIRHVMLLVGLLSLAIGAMFMRRTNNYKRFLSYSTVENMGIAAIGLGLGGIGIWAAVFHVMCHTLVKSSLMLQAAVLRHVYNGYRINRIGDYISINSVGAIGFIVGSVAVLAFPPSPLFVSELMVMKQAVADGNWAVLATVVLLLCIVVYSFCSRIVRLCYQPNQDPVSLSGSECRGAWSALVLLIAAMAVGVWQPEALRALIDSIVNI